MTVPLVSVIRRAAPLVVWCATCAPAAAAPAPTGLVAPAASRPATAPAAAQQRAGVIRFLEDRVRRDPEDILALNRLAGEYLARFRDTGDDADLALSAKAAAQSLAAVPAELNKGGLAARARASFALHRFAETRADAGKLQALEPGKRYPLELLGDALLELGEYERAAQAYRGLEESDAGHPTTQARLARLALVTGDTAGANRRLSAAVKLAGELSPPMPDVLAWAHVQAGQLAFSTGDWDAAEKHYLAAVDAKPEDWAALDHLAELRAAQKRYDEAVSLYQRVTTRVPRPELFQSLGDVYKAAGKADDAKAAHDRALEKYLKAVGEGSAHYYHHLAGFYCDTRPDAAEAVKWAKKDLEVRRSIHAWDALAWALYNAGDFAAAADAADKALATGAKDAHLLYHASLIFYRAGKVDRGKECLRRAAEANPRFMEFHVHR